MSVVSGGASPGNTSTASAAKDEPPQFDYFTTARGVEDALQSGDVALLRAAWLLKWARKPRAVLERRQELPDEAFCRASDVIRNGKFAKIILAVSHPWLTPAHPDPEGHQLQSIATFVSYAVRDGYDIVIFMDWCSLYQEPRTQEEAASYSRSWQHAALWFAHEQCWKLFLTEIPRGFDVVPASNRGWLLFENTCARILSDGTTVFDWSNYDNTILGFKRLAEKCSVRRSPPVLPDIFARNLREKVLTDSEDFAVLERRYRLAFMAFANGIEILDYSSLGWCDSEAAELAGAIRHCARLHTLSLVGNMITADGAKRLAKALLRCRRLTDFHVDGNPIGSEGTSHLTKAWRHAKKPEYGLSLGRLPKEKKEGDPRKRWLDDCWLKDGSARIEFKKNNPKRYPSQAYDRYESYKAATTVREAYDLGARTLDLKTDRENRCLKMLDERWARSGWLTVCSSRASSRASNRDALQLEEFRSVADVAAEKLSRLPRAGPMDSAAGTITEEDDDSDLQSDDGFEEFIYEGSFRNGRRFGPGVMTSGKSLRYEGQFQNDVFHGHGVATFADGGTYTGQWADGQKCGHGEYITGDGLKYVGSWKNGHKHGAGSQEYQGGGRYEGDWKLGMCDGKGQFFFVDGSLYEGWWSKGRHNGPGVLKKPDGSREQHFYEEGLLTKREVHALPKLSDFASMLRRPSIICQVRTNVHEKVRLPSLEVSKKLMSPECAEIDLSAPPLRSARRTSPQKKSQSQTYPLTAR